jgi:hypothetical protein
MHSGLSVGVDVVVKRSSLFSWPESIPDYPAHSQPHKEKVNNGPAGFSPAYYQM